MVPKPEQYMAHVHSQYIPKALEQCLDLGSNLTHLHYQSQLIVNWLPILAS